MTTWAPLKRCCRGHRRGPCPGVRETCTQAPVGPAPVPPTTRLTLRRPRETSRGRKGAFEWDRLTGAGVGGDGRSLQTALQAVYLGLLQRPDRSARKRDRTALQSSPARPDAGQPTPATREEANTGNVKVAPAGGGGRASAESARCSRVDAFTSRAVPGPCEVGEVQGARGQPLR